MKQNSFQQGFRIYILSIILIFVSLQIFAQADPWILKAENIDTLNYHGITVANGMIGIVS